MFQYKNQVLRKYKMSELKLPLTLEMTSHAGYDTLTSNEVTHSIHPQPPCWAGCFKGYSGFRLVPGDLWVGPVPYLLHSALNKEITHPPACSWVSFTSPSSMGFPGGHHPSPASSFPLPKLLGPPGLLSQLTSLRFPVLLHASLLPFPLISHPSAHLFWFPDLLSLSGLPGIFFVYFFPSPYSTFFPLPQDSLYSMSCLS